jgi:hypothetical protein
LGITVNNTPAQPSPITGSASACQNTTNNSYSVINDPSATSYVWSYSGTGVTINGTTNSVTLNFNATATSGTLSVTASSGSCSGIARTLAITVNPQPGQPGHLVRDQLQYVLTKIMWYTQFLMFQELRIHGVTAEPACQV